MDTGQSTIGFSQAVGTQAMQLVRVHPSYTRAIAKMTDADLPDTAGAGNQSVLKFYDAAATPRQRWTALTPFMEIFASALVQRFASAWTADAVAFFVQQVSQE